MAEPKEKKKKSTKKIKLIGQKPDIEPQIQEQIDAEAAKWSRHWRLNGLNGFDNADAV